MKIYSNKKNDSYRHYVVQKEPDTHTHRVRYLYKVQEQAKLIELS